MSIVPDKNPLWDHSDNFDDEGLSIEPKADTEGKEPVVDGNQDSMCGSPECYNGSAQNFQLKQPPHHCEEAGTVVASSSTPQLQELFIDPSPQCLLLHTAFTLRENIVARLTGQKKSRHPESGTEDSI